MHQVVYSENALKDLRKIDHTVARRIVKKIGIFATHEDVLHFAKPLKDFGKGRYRFRIGDYRAIFSIDKSGHIKILLILNVKHRKEVYLRN